jgi:RNA polymerase sigma factor (sigma-70 family)
MKRTKSKPKPTESALDYENPNYIEISMSHEDLEKAAKQQSLLLEQKQDYDKRRHIVRKQEKLLKKIFKASSQVLTDAQFQIFSMRYIYQMPESEIAQQVGCVQNYVSRALKASIKKIQKRLRVPINLKGFAKDRKNKED